MDIIKKQFGKQLKSLRKSKKYTQESLSESIGINLRQLARIEAGESFVSSETLYKICKTLQVSPKNLFDFTINQDNSENKNLIINEKVENLFKELEDKIKNISDNEQKLEYMLLAYKSMQDKNAVNELKLLIRGIELTQR